MTLGMECERLNGPSKTSCQHTLICISHCAVMAVALMSRALAALAFAHLIPGGQMRVSEQGQRADYWLPRLRCALEISGTEQGRELPRRHREKIAQVLANPWRWNGYAFVCCFSAARRLIRWSYHTLRQESGHA